MIPKSVYPIGTELITRRRSQAALYLEIFEEYPVALIEGEPHNFITYEKAYTWNHITNKLAVNPHYWFSDAWKVIVTEENQKWLSPIPIFSTFKHYENKSADLVIFHGETNHVPYPQFWKEHNIYDGTQTVEKRTYPNGQRLPILEWDETILPTNKVILLKENSHDGNL